MKKAVFFIVVFVICLVLLGCIWIKLNELPTFQIGWSGFYAFQSDSANQMGFRGKTIQPKKDTSERIILFVGDSQVEGDALPFKFMIENLVQKFLQQKDSLHIYKCYSVGAGGFGQDQEFLALKEYFKKYQADKVVLWFTPENDVWNNIFPTHWPLNANPKPTFWIAHGQLKGPNYQWLENFPDANKPRWRQSARAFKDMDTKWEAKLPPAYKGIPVSSFKGVLAPTPIFEEPIGVEKSHYSIFLTPRSERMKYGIQLTRFLLDSIQETCHANKADFAVFLALNDGVVSMRDSSFSVKVYDQVYLLSKAMFFENVDAIMQGFPFHLFKLDTEWKQVSRQDNHHFNHEAQTEIAHKIVDQILLPE
jgi:hypothetical protein